MNTQVLRYVLEVERAGSISKAAENLYMSQPNLSKAIKELEHSLNITIFHRTSGGVFLTQKGREFVSLARNVLSQVTAMEELQTKEEQTPYSLQLCAPHTAYISTTFAQLANALRKEGAVIDFQYREMNSAQIVRSVVEDRSHLGIIRCQSTHEKHFCGILHENGLSCMKLAEFPLCALMGKNHPLSKCETVTMEQLRAYPQVAQDDWREGVNACSDRQRLHGGDNSGELSTHELGTRFEILCCMDDAYMVSEPMAQEVLDRMELAERVIVDAPYTLSDGIIFRTGYQFTPVEAQLVERLQEKVKQMLARVQGK